MSRVQEIEQAIDNLTPEEFQQISRWILEKDQDLWDRQLDEDSAAGRLDFLFAEADQDDLREWPRES